MSIIHRLNNGFRWSHTGRLLLAVVLGAAAGITAGRTVIASVSGSVAIVDGLSMEPTYSPGARVYTAPITGSLQRGDIVLIDDADKETALKRIIGLPGETVQLWRGAVFINRRMLREPYLPRLTYTFPDERVHTITFRLGPDQYFVLGDNRARSIDSRTYGPVIREHIRSRVPSPQPALRPELARYALPLPGKRTLERL